MITPIFLTINIHIGLTRLLEVGPSNAKYDLDKKLRKGCTNVDWGDDDEIEGAMAADNNEKNDEKDP